jgi:uncharacterized protein VirK/YbjX
MLQKNLQKAVNKWKNEGLRLQKPHSATEVKTAFAKSGIAAIKEVIEMYSVFNGFADGEPDSECMTFWTVEKILAEYQKESQYVVFADFLFDSHWYAFKTDDENTASIHLYYGDNETVKISNSLNEFFELYLTEPAKLLFETE